MPRSRELKKVSDLFETYKKRLQAPEGSVITAFQEVVQDVLELTIPKSKVSYSPHSKVLTIRVGGPLKQEVLLHKKDILTHLKGRLGPKSAPAEII